MSEQAIVAYDSRQYAAIVAEMKNFAKQRWPSWNIDAKTIGNILLECFADQAEKIEYRMDRIVNELFPDTAVDYRSVLRWARMLAYPVQSVVPAEATVTFALKQASIHGLTIPKGTVVGTPGQTQILYETAIDATIAIGEISVDVAARQVESREDVFSGTGLSWQVYQTVWGAVWTDSIVITVDGQEWTKVNDFLDSVPTDLHYRAELTQAGAVLIIFGNGTRGKCPALNADIVVSYKTSLGSSGNVVANALVELVSVIYNTLGYIADLSVTNAAPGTGGEDQETLNHVREAIPKWISTSSTCITRLDFEKAASSVVGVVRCLAQGHDEDASIPALDVWVYIIPTGGGAPSSTLKEEVMYELTVNRAKVNSLQIRVKDPLYIVLDISATVAPGYGYTPSTVQAAVSAAITAFFSYTRLDSDGNYALNWGKGFYVPQLTSYVMAAVPGVASITFGDLADVSPEENEIPALGAVSVVVV